MDRINSIRATFDIFKQSGVIEVRSMNSRNKTFSGYYKDRERLFNDLMSNDDKTWYFVMNDIDDACYSREQCEKILPYAKQTTKDKEIKKIRWILIDSDPVRPTGVSSTDAEKKKALEKTGEVYTYLRKEGFSEPVVCDSGNGYHLLYSVFISPSDSEYVKKFLLALDMMFSDEFVEIDTTVFNPARITKVYGTIARKGANTKERPHRASCIKRIPAEINPTPLALIQKIGSLIPEPEKPTWKNNYSEKFDIDSFIAKNGIQVAKQVERGGDRKIVLECCPFDENHKSPDAAIFVRANGAIGFKCFHNSCRDKTWKDVREHFDPMCYQRQQEQPRSHDSALANTIEAQSENNQQEQADAGKPHFLRLQDIEVLDRSKIVNVKTGIDALDKKLIGMNKGELSIWSGGNGSGKSTFLSQLAIESVEQNFRVAMFSGELTSNRAKTWLQLQAAGRQNVLESNDHVSYYVPRDKAKAIDEWTADRLWLYNNQYGSKVGSVLSDFKRHMSEHPTDVVIIDNLMSLDLSGIKADKYDKQTQLVLHLSEMAKQYNVHIHFVCHPRKPVGFLRKSDISGTADLTNSADNVFMMHRVNNDFMRQGGDFLGKSEIKRYQEFTNVIEIMKNRDLGVSDEFVGLYFEPQSKRMLNYPNENRVYGWEDKVDRDFVAAISGLPE